MTPFFRSLCIALLLCMSAPLALAGSTHRPMQGQFLATTLLDGSGAISTPNEFFATYPQCDVFAVDFTYVEIDGENHVRYMIIHLPRSECGFRRSTN